MAKFHNSGFRRPTGNTPLRPAPKAPLPEPKKPLKIEGDTELWVTLQRVTDPNSGWVKTTRAMATPAGVLVNTCSRKVGTTFAAEALCLVPGTKLTRANNGSWRVTPL